jgi:hypothetical protein
MAALDASRDLDVDREKGCLYDNINIILSSIFIS